VTITTPGLQDKPDWYNAAAYATEINVVPPIVTAGPVFVMSAYVGNAPSFGFICQIAGGGWHLNIQQGNEPELPPSFLPNSDYLGDADCTVHDNLPVAAAWVTATIDVTSGGPLTVNFEWWLSQTPDAGSVINLDSGIVIDETAANCPHGVTTTFYGKVLMPGQHQYCFNPNANLTGVVNISGIEGGNLHGRIGRWIDPVAGVSLQAECIVSNIQPCWQVVNSGGADVTVDAALTRGF
jgi:hypothetical protein